MYLRNVGSTAHILLLLRLSILLLFFLFLFFVLYLHVLRSVPFFLRAFGVEAGDWTCPNVWPPLWCVTQYNEQVWWRAKQADNEVLISVAFNTLRPGPIWIWIPWNDPPSGAETTINSKWQQWRLLSSESHDERILPHLPTAVSIPWPCLFLPKKVHKTQLLLCVFHFKRSRVRSPEWRSSGACEALYAEQGCAMNSGFLFWRFRLKSSKKEPVRRLWRQNVKSQMKITT